MRNLIVILMLAGAIVRAGSRDGENAGRSVTVCMQDLPARGDVRLAQWAASQIFAEIGVTLRWYGIRQCPSEDAILVILSTETRADLTPGVLAYAMPYEGHHIVVYLDRITGLADSRPRFLFGYVLAHEIAHILEGFNGHSDTGIMKASWNSADFGEMGRRRLRFSESDICLIHAPPPETGPGVRVLTAPRRD